MTPVNNGCENFFYVVSGTVTVSLPTKKCRLEKDGYCWIPPQMNFEMSQEEEETATVLWIKKIYEPLEGIAVPEAASGNAKNLKAEESTAEFTKECLPASTDFGFDMSVNILIY